MDIAEDVAGRIADSAIGLGDLFEDCITDAGVVAFVVGVVFGVYPAGRASMLDPSEARRYE